MYYEYIITQTIVLTLLPFYWWTWIILLTLYQKSSRENYLTERIQMIANT